jgi:hypothetical protein
MKRPSPADEDTARRLLACEGGNGGTAEERIAAVGRVYEKLDLQFAPLVGSAGFQALLARSAKLLQGEFPGLGKSAAVESSTSLRECLRAQDPETIAATAAGLFGAFLGLLKTFIGERLTTEVLRRAWPAIGNSAFKEEAKK